jgi:hypothetical protein
MECRFIFEGIKVSNTSGASKILFLPAIAYGVLPTDLVRGKQHRSQISDRRGSDCPVLSNRQNLWPDHP